MSLTNLQEDSCESIFTSLLELLKKELIVYHELKEVMIHEKKILKKPNLDELNHVNAVKENIILKARMLEEGRVNILKKIAHHLDLNMNSIKLKQLADYADAKQKKEIETIMNGLTEIAREINALNAANKDLLAVSINNVKSSLDFINSNIFSAAVYMQSGRMKSMDKNGTYLHQEG